MTIVFTPKRVSFHAPAFMRAVNCNLAPFEQQPARHTGKLLSLPALSPCGAGGSGGVSAISGEASPGSVLNLHDNPTSTGAQ